MATLTDTRIDQHIRSVLAGSSVSFWLKNALQSALDHDPVDAAHDAQLLADLLSERCDAILKGE